MLVEGVTGDLGLPMIFRLRSDGTVHDPAVDFQFSECPGYLSLPFVLVGFFTEVSETIIEEDHHS